MVDASRALLVEVAAVGALVMATACSNAGSQQETLSPVQQCRVLRRISPRRCRCQVRPPHYSQSTVPSGSMMPRVGERPGMAGMMSPANMAALKNAHGVGAGELFLAQMISHHEGAVTMADKEISTCFRAWNIPYGGIG